MLRNMRLESFYNDQGARKHQKFHLLKKCATMSISSSLILIMMTFGGGGKILDMQIFNHEWTDSVRTEIFMGILSKIAQITSDQLITSRKLSGNFQMLYQLLPA